MVDGKVAEIVCFIYTFHLTWPTLLHYLVKRRWSKFLPNTGFITVRLLIFGACQREERNVATYFLLRGNWQTYADCPEFLSFTLWQGCRGDWILMPIPIPYPQENLWESPQNSHIHRIPKSSIPVPYTLCIFVWCIYHFIFLSCMPSSIIVCTQYCTAWCMNIIIQYVQIKLSLTVYT